VAADRAHQDANEEDCMSLTKSKLCALMFTASLLLLGATGCSGGAEPQTEEEPSTSSSEALLGNCSFQAFRPGRNPVYPKAGDAWIGCSNIETLELEVCLQQYVGAWETIGWTCRTFTRVGGDLDIPTANLPYYTAGRWYRTWAWGYANGHDGQSFSNACLGNGGSGCN
jgi:hypothetical protein